MGTDQLYERTQIELFPMSLFSTGKLSVIWMFYDFILWNEFHLYHKRSVGRVNMVKVDSSYQMKSPSIHKSKQWLQT